MRALDSRIIGVAVVAVIAAGSELSAHRRDELLQAARIAIDPARVELQIDVTPGIAVADAFLAALDSNRDGRFSAEEQQRFASDLLSAIALDVDGRPLGIRTVACTFSDPDTFRRGEGTIHVRAAAALPRLADGEHHLALENRFRPDLSVYLANALVPDSNRIAITAQHRDTEQRDLTIDYVLGPTHTALFNWLSGFAGLTACAAVFLRPRPLTHLRG